MVFAGSFLLQGHRFNDAVDDYCALLSLPRGLIENVSDGTNAHLVAHFEENMQAARKALEETNDEQLGTLFLLKSNGQVLYSAPKIIDIGVTLNHWVHHRGQLTVYMRLNDIPVPSIYGPSADEKGFTPPS